jgi:DNA-binding SARP family transcriptional activator
MQDNNPLLAALTREGVLIKVSIHFYRGCKKLKAEDIGLKANDVSDRLISLGHKRLLPREATASLSLIEGRSHAFVEDNTFPFLNGLAHFVPNARLEDVMLKLKDLEAEFWKAKDQFLEHYSQHREKASNEWYEMAKKLVHDPERVVASIEASFPLTQQMDRFFGYDLQLFQIKVPERLGLDLIGLEDQQQLMTARQQATQEAATKIRRDVQLFVADCVASLREQTAKLCEEMLTSMQTSETGVHQKTLNRLVKFIDQFKQMNFVNDQEMERQLEQVRRELLSKTAEEYRDSKTARGHLVNGLKQLANQARELAKQDASELVQRFGSLGMRKFNLAA